MGFGEVGCIGHSQFFFCYGTPWCADVTSCAMGIVLRPARMQCNYQGNRSPAGVKRTQGKVGNGGKYTWTELCLFPG